MPTVTPEHRHVSALLQAAQCAGALDRAQAASWAAALADLPAPGPAALRQAIDQRKSELPQAGRLSALLPPVEANLVGAGWERLARLGEGPLGQTWLGWREDHGAVVLRLLPGRLFVDGTGRERWLEARLAERVPTRTHLVPVHDAAREGDQALLVRGWYGGAIDWQRRLVQKGPLAEDRAIAYVGQALRGLAELAATGRWHGDLRPDKALVCADGRIRLSDAGCSRDPTSGRLLLGLTPDRLGILKWCAPECLDGGPGDLRSDIYALGCLLFHLLSGRSPFSGSTQQIADRHRASQRPDVRRYAPAVSERLAKIIVKAMRIKAEKRFQDPRAFLHSLQRCHQELRAAPPTPANPAYPPASPPPAAARAPRDAATTAVDEDLPLELVTPPDGHPPVS